MADIDPGPDARVAGPGKAARPLPELSGRYAVTRYAACFRDPALEQAYLRARDGLLRRFAMIGGGVCTATYIAGGSYDLLLYGPADGVWLQVVRILVVLTSLGAVVSAARGQPVSVFDRWGLAAMTLVYTSLVMLVFMRPSEAWAIALYFVIVNLAMLMFLPVSMLWGLAVAIVASLVFIGQSVAQEGSAAALGLVLLVGPSLALGYTMTLRGRMMSRGEFAAFDLAGHALAEARQAERRFRLLAENVSDIFMTIDSRRLVSYISPSVEWVLGRRPGDLTGRPAFDLVHPDDIAGTIAGLDHAWQGVEGLRAQFRVAHADGRWIWVEASPRLMRDEDEPYLVTIARDIGSRMAQDTELRRARFEAEAANHAKSRFLAQMSHELRTPLNAVIGFAEVMRAGIHGPLEPPVYRDYAGYIEEGGRHLLTLINDVLDLAKVEAGRMDLAMRWLDLDEAVEGALRLVRGEAQAGCLDLRCRLDEGAAVYADSRALKQILVNLLSNAVKFTPLGGEVVITGHVDDSSATVIEIADSGAGMTAEQLAIALEPYRQVHPDMAPDRRGTGLGLPLARALTELHGARFAIASLPGRGTTVTLTFPAGAPPPPRS
ncbi:PAS domain-containing sensor histidine kinase [Zavarzinia sp. CC-PAN008]|uniref:sensor histidine kinase n=1 Tax=Zavarzinia sp. CC-PAN008 TaxID=3243332 RepID=UPI003F746777